ncbi:MAG: SigB/SigF/SigG family RNA polymerase sigma factor [Actinomycetota bacterium]
MSEQSERSTGDEPSKQVDEAHDDSETISLFERLSEDPTARDEITEQYLSLADYLARRFQGRGEAIDDLTQVARVGLLNAIDRFDPKRGVKFSTYATTTIVGELKHHFRDRAWALRVPRRLQEIGRRLNSLVGELSHELGRSPSIREMAQRAALDVEEVLEALEAQQAYATHSLDAPLDEEGRTSADVLGNEDDEIEKLEGWSSVAPAIRDLPRRERRIIYLRFFRGRTQVEIADELGISQMHVSRILTRTLARLREEVSPR